MEFRSYEVSLETPVGRTINVIVVAINEKEAADTAQRLLSDFGGAKANVEAVHMVIARRGANLVSLLTPAA